MKTSKRNVLCIVLSLFAVLALGLVCAHADPILSIEPAVSPVIEGSFFDVFVDIADVSDLYAYEFEINFDPAIIAAQNIMEGSFLSLGGTTYFIAGEIDNMAGTITLTGNSLLSATSGVTGSGSLASLEFLALSEGTSYLTLSNVMLLDSNISDIDPIISNGTVMVSSNAVPEPASMLLLGFGLVGMATVRRKLQ